jgi:hypothetical protein
MTDSRADHPHPENRDGGQGPEPDTVVADEGLLVDEGEVVDDGMGPDAPADIAGEDEPVDSDTSDPLDEATAD